MFIVDELDELDKQVDSLTCCIYKGYLDDRPIIVKKFKSLTRGEDEVRSHAIRDIVIATQMSNHKNVLKLLGCCLEFPVPALVHEYAAHGPLNDHEFLPWKIRLRIAKELAHALRYLHTALSRPVIHRDIGSHSIFLDQDFVPKFSNFSISITIPPHQSHASDGRKYTSVYSDPEYMESGSVTEKSDVYSFGVLLLNFITGKKDESDVWSRKYQTLVRYVKDHVVNKRGTKIVDPNILREGGGDGQAQQVEAFLTLALACTRNKGNERPDMIDVAKELRRIEKSI
ncbi:serine/threonine-protein kinase ZRK1-like [Corylus avellana]|uniref:serine/threonine-protein kinase ZRK1-like n=1 Tax=Corylus avellana TaxID=13451 RepID=UPI001E220374|nr:serine/threonine-protein kinase ZRK1-like [Corylus avellana]